MGRDPNLGLHLRAWAREHGHTVNGDVLTKGTATTQRWRAAVRAGTAAEPAAKADPTWGLAARGALVESGGPALAIADLL
ncbi:MAG: ferritin-like domain-containing protein, partial [Acidimicrobiia bacterium]|nr:ferritin-like domain-containing protein [Acidimicrobiia bacterium]